MNLHFKSSLMEPMKVRVTSSQRSLLSERRYRHQFTLSGSCRSRSASCITAGDFECDPALRQLLSLIGCCGFFTALRSAKINTWLNFVIVTANGMSCVEKIKEDPSAGTRGGTKEIYCKNKTQGGNGKQN